MSRRYHNLPPKIPRPLPGDDPGFTAQRIAGLAKGYRIGLQLRCHAVRVGIAQIPGAVIKRDHFKGFGPQALDFNRRRQPKRPAGRLPKHIPVAFILGKAQHLAGFQ